MKNKFVQAVLAGIIATAVMTVFGVIAPFIGLPRMNPAEMLSAMLSTSIVTGYILHFMIGIIFASVYVYLFNGKVRINSKLWKGALFGFAVFIFAQLMLWLIGMIMPMPEMEGSKTLMMLGSLISHLIYGVFVSWLVPLKAAATSLRTKIAGQH
jgi:uncharacterized membrane protein YagU involved in acid resistance